MRMLKWEKKSPRGLSCHSKSPGRLALGRKDNGVCISSEFGLREVQSISLGFGGS